MATQYDTWLTSLAQQQKGPVTLQPAVRSLAYSLRVRIQGNWTTATLRGSVKAAPDSPTELAVFTVGTATFADGFTTFPTSLTGLQTGALPADSDGDGVETFVFDFTLNNERLFGGLFPLSGYVTEPA